MVMTDCSMHYLEFYIIASVLVCCNNNFEIILCPNLDQFI